MPYCFDFCNCIFVKIVPAHVSFEMLRKNGKKKRSLLGIHGEKHLIWSFFGDFVFLFVCVCVCERVCLCVYAVRYICWFFLSFFFSFFAICSSHSMLLCSLHFDEDCASAFVFGCTCISICDIILCECAFQCIIAHVERVFAKRIMEFQKKKSVYFGNLAHRAKVKPLILKIAPGTKFVDVEFVRSNRLTKTKKLITIRTVKIKTKTNDLFNTVKWGLLRASSNSFSSHFALDIFFPCSNAF